MEATERVEETGEKNSGNAAADAEPHQKESFDKYWEGEEKELRQIRRKVAIWLSRHFHETAR